MSQFIDQNQFWFTQERSVDVEFKQLVALVLDALLRNQLQTANHFSRLGPAMRFDDTNDHIDALCLQRPGGTEHGIGFTDTGAGPEEYFQLAPLYL